MHQYHVSINNCSIECRWNKKFWLCCFERCVTFVCTSNEQNWLTKDFDSFFLCHTVILYFTKFSLQKIRLVDYFNSQSIVAHFLCIKNNSRYKWMFKALFLHVLFLEVLNPVMMKFCSHNMLWFKNCINCKYSKHGDSIDFILGLHNNRSLLCYPKYINRNNNLPIKRYFL